MIAFIFTHWRLIVYASAAIGLFTVGWHAHKAIVDADAGRALERAINERLQDQEETRSIGMDLETGLNQYRKTVKKLDGRADHARDSDSLPRFDARSVRRAADRIAAGKAARERLD